MHTKSKLLVINAGVISAQQIKIIQEQVDNGESVTVLLPSDDFHLSDCVKSILKVIFPSNITVDISKTKGELAALLWEGGATSGPKSKPNQAIESYYASSVLYMLYWYQRLMRYPDRQREIQNNLLEYIGEPTNPTSMAIVDAWLQDKELLQKARNYVEQILLPKRTVDLVVVGSHDEKDKQILCNRRSRFPEGLALPGGFILDEDEDNPLGLEASVFAALRVGGKKILGLDPAQAVYGAYVDGAESDYYFVTDADGTKKLKMRIDNVRGYHYKDQLKNITLPSDPRHLVDTVGFLVEVEGEVEGKDLLWQHKGDIMNPDVPKGGLVFNHHREIIAHLSARTSIEKKRDVSHYERIRGIIKNPRASHATLKQRFEQNHNDQETSFPELFPIVDKILQDMYSEDMNQLCKSNPALVGIRDKCTISLRHCCLQNRTFCPYRSTLDAIAKAIACFDLAARLKRGFYSKVASDDIIEHNPRKQEFASYHMYRYEYRKNMLMNKLPHEIVLPTYEGLGATDLMRVRGVPIRFVGLSNDFLYVDEFEQSPEEFLMHDINHSYRMVQEDEAYMQKHGKTREELTAESCAFIDEYLEKIKIKKTDNEEQREIKKLKKIILFEIVHEDARPFLKDVICDYIQLMEGGPVPFEVPAVDDKTGYMDVVDTLDNGISTLSYVRNKLQHGFYDKMDAQLTQIVSPKYRYAERIAKAAYEMLVELDAKPSPQAELDNSGHVSYEWLMYRTCSVGPDNVHGVDFKDPAMEKYGDGAAFVNPKRYQVEV
ncbi:MAG: hypothetical protein WC004_02330 [Candidatus Absconditabacterales bacterium]